MIRTISPQVIDAKNRKEGIVYIEVGKSTTVPENNPSMIVFQLTFKELINVRKDVVLAVNDENGNPTKDENGEFITETKTCIFPTFNVLFKDEAKFKLSTFREQIGAVWPEDYDQVLMEQIAYVNSKEWTRNELQIVYFWNLAFEDMEALSTEQITQLTTPYFLES